MIHRNPAVPDYFFDLGRHDSIADLARAHGDEIMRRYEDLNLIYIPYFPLDLDINFLRALVFPEAWKKIGTSNGIAKSMVVREGGALSFNNQHVLLNAFPQLQVASYLQNQIVSVNGQIRHALAMMFPKYYSLNPYNITWRMTETKDEAMHLDAFRGGQLTPESQKDGFRIKLFINIDDKPRKWRTTFATPDLLKRFRDQFPDAMPNDLDMVCFFIGDSGMLNDLPYHEIDIPPMGAVIGESQCISHAIIYGHRMIAAECFCKSYDMLDPSKNPQVALSRWLADANIAIDPNPKPFLPSGKTKAYIP